MSRIIDTLVRERKISRSEAERALQDFLANNEMAILSAMSLTIPKVEETLFMYDSIDHALAARYEQFGVPTSFVYPKKHWVYNILADIDLSTCPPLAIIYFEADGLWKYALVKDIHHLCDLSKLTVWTIVAPMYPIYGQWYEVDHSDQTLTSVNSSIEWYDTSYFFHRTKRYDVAGPNILRYRYVR